LREASHSSRCVFDQRCQIDLTIVSILVQCKTMTADNLMELSKWK